MVCTLFSRRTSRLIAARFSTLFVGSLSVDHLHRVWDIFLYDGKPVLVRSRCFRD